MNLKAVLEKLVDFFLKEGIDFALIGAFALKAYGYVRATQDVDFVVRAKDQQRIVGFLESLGYETVHRSRGFSNHLHSLQGLGRIDFVYVERETAQRIFSEAQPVFVLGNLSIPVARPEHLIAMKVFAMKNDSQRTFREMADIQHLLGYPDIDVEEVREYFEKYGLIEKFDELTQKQ